MVYQDFSADSYPDPNQVVDLSGAEVAGKLSNSIYTGKIGEHRHDPTEATATFLQAAQLNREDPLLQGSQLVFPNYGQLVMTGDIHGHRRNFDKLVQYCNLENFSDRHVILHELIHEELKGLDSVDRSHEVLLDAARWKCAFPEQVHFLQSNHDLSQVTGRDITKSWGSTTAAFEKALSEAFGSRSDSVMDALNTLIRSHPLAGRTPNRIFLSHSLPNARDLERFDPEVLNRVLTDEDFARGSSAYSLVWGRRQSEQVVEKLAEMLDVDFFICGHQTQEMGYDVWHKRMIILSSEHNHGRFLPIDLSRPVDIRGLTSEIRPFAGVA